MGTNGCVGWIAATCLAAGCYTGISGGGPGAGGADASDSAGGTDGASSNSGAGDDTDGGDTDADGDPVSPACVGEALLGPSKMARLTQEEYINAVFDLVGVEVDPGRLAADEKLGPFDANLDSNVGALQLAQYFTQSDGAARQVVEAGGTGCASADEDCIRAFVDRLAHRAYRRVLTDDQRARINAVFEAGLDESVETATRMAISAVLQSPYFLYRIDAGTPDADDPSLIHLDDHSIAQRLSFLIWGSVPDEELLEAAAAGELTDAEARREQARRMLADPKARRALGRRYAEWFKVAGLAELTKDAEVFESFTADLAADMERAFATFAADTVVGDGTVDDLLLSRRAYVTPRLAAYYGVEGGPGGDADGLQEVELPHDERAGLLTRAGIMAMIAHDNQTAPVQRGAFVREELLCQQNPPPPPDVDDTPVEIDPNATARERLAAHRENATCATCHSRLDLVGLGFEHYDGAGRYRTMDGSVPVDASGELLGADVGGEFNGAIELSTMLADSVEVSECFIRQHVRLGQLRQVGEEDVAADCMVEALASRLNVENLSLVDLLVETVVHETFGQRIIAEE